ncbi:aldo/keto reductase [Leifsonia sp. NPDC056665]|uniref:aldo/keto reductase n=1 Tax=Leifsonia sp. NPDC056665 TaxID=3345901 RepID=UPI0036B01077
MSELSFGAASLGNLFRETTESEAAEAVQAALDVGIRYFDTAPHYGLGLSERRLGSALTRFPRDELVISSKVGRLLVPNENPTGRDNDLFLVGDELRREWDFSRDGILRSIEASLTRLQTDYLDIVYLHDPDVSGDPDAAEKGAEALIELRSEGVVRAVGIGSNDAAAVTDLFRVADIDLAMVAGRYTLLDNRAGDDIFEAADGRPIVAAGVFNSGLLAKHRPDAGALYDYSPASADLIARTNEIADICDRFGVTLPQVAIAFPLRNLSVASVTLGMRSADQVKRNERLFRAGVPDALWVALAEASLLTSGE